MLVAPIVRGSCGTTRPNKVRYKVLLECGPILNAFGFVVDQTTVDSLFTRYTLYSASCERLAMQACDEILQLVRAENPDAIVHSVSVALSPRPYAATIEFKKEV